MNYAAVVLAGGAGRRLGGADKPALAVGDRPLLHRVLDAVADASPRIVVGPDRELPGDVRLTRERPPGAGPVAAIAAGLALVGDAEQVALLAADLPFLTAPDVAALRHAATPGPAPAGRGSGAEGTPGRGAAAGRGAGEAFDAAVYTDGRRRQYLCAVWRTAALRDRLAALGPPEGRALRELYGHARIAEISSAAHPPPWYDCDTDTDLRRAQAWLRPEGDPPG